MHSLSRRRFLQLIGASALALGGCSSLDLRKRTGPRVVVIGGGFGGASAAKYLRLADPSIEVVLITPEPTYLTCPSSNLTLAGLNGLGDLTQSYRWLNIDHGVIVVYDRALGIDAERSRVILASGQAIPYDRLIVAPGIALRWDAIEGYDEAAARLMPHAWQAGAQTLALRRRISAMRDGGLLVIAPPPAPYRGPAAPYERASLIAHYFKTFKPRSKVLILDANDGFAEQALFQEGWQALYGGMIEWVPRSEGGRVLRVEPATGTVHTEAEALRADVANIIPPQAAGALAAAAGLSDADGWCPVDARSFESTRVPGIHVIGDACRAEPLPKSAFSANSQAKVAAQAVAALLTGAAPGEPSWLSASYSLLAPDYGISATQLYELRDGVIQRTAGGGGSSPLGAPAQRRAKEADYARGWYRSITADSFS